MNTVDGRARMAELARPLVSRLPNGVYRELLIERLGETVGLGASRLDRILQPAAAENVTAKRSAGVRQVSNKSAANQPSVVRRAISLLLNHPQAALKLHAEQLAGVERPGVELLTALIDAVQAEPSMTTARLLERWRHDENGRHLGKLAAVELPDDTDFDAAAELTSCVQQLVVAGRKDRIDFLIEKQRLDGLSEDEKSELQALLKAA